MEQIDSAMVKKKPKHLGLYITTGIFDIVGALVLLAIVVLCIIFYFYIKDLMSVAGLSSFAGLVYGSFGSVVIAVASILISIPFAIAFIVLDVFLIKRRSDISADHMTWLLITNVGLTVLSLLFFVFLLDLVLFLLIFNV